MFYARYCTLFQYSRASYMTFSLCAEKIYIWTPYQATYGISKSESSYDFILRNTKFCMKCRAALPVFRLIVNGFS